MVAFDRPALKARAKESLSGNWGQAILVYFIYAAIMGTASSTGAGAAVCGGALQVGLATYFLNLMRGRERKIEDLFGGFTSCFANSLVAYLISTILICLGFIVIVPGVLLALGWSQFPYILRDNPELDGWESLKRSKQLMMGHKGEFFMLGLSFLGWMLLTAATFGLAGFYAFPYMQATFAGYYDYLKSSQAGDFSQAGY